MIIPLFLILGVIIFVLFSEIGKWPSLLILVPILVFFTHMLMTTDYTLYDEKLVVRCGFLYLETIDISSIQSIAETNNPLSSPALSLDRLDVTYQKQRHVMISPKEKEAFIAAIQEIHPSIVIRRSKPRTETFSA